MKGIIIYKGKYGATRQYAEWLSDQLTLQLSVSDAFNKDQLEKFNFFVLGSSVYAGKILIKKWLKNNVAAIQSKKIFLFIVSGTTTDKREILEGYLQANVPAEIRNKVEVFYLPGRLIMKKLSWFHRLMLNVAAALAKGAEAKKELLLEYDNVKIENTRALVNAVNTFYNDKMTKQPLVEKDKPAFF